MLINIIVVIWSDLLGGVLPRKIPISWDREPGHPQAHLQQLQARETITLSYRTVSPLFKSPGLVYVSLPYRSNLMNIHLLLSYNN